MTSAVVPVDRYLVWRFASLLVCCKYSVFIALYFRQTMFSMEQKLNSRKVFKLKTVLHRSCEIAVERFHWGISQFGRWFGGFLRKNVVALSLGQSPRRKHARGRLGLFLSKLGSFG